MTVGHYQRLLEEESVDDDGKEPRQG
jgi:hypothetical protein